MVGEESEGNADTAELFDVAYDEDNDVLFLYIDNGLELEPVFSALNKAIDGQDIGTLVFYLDGTRGDDYEKELNQKIGELSCASMERLGLNYHIVDYPEYSWLKLADKTDKLYLDTNFSVFWEYDDGSISKLSKFKDLQIGYNPTMLLNGISKFTGVETISFIPKYAVPRMHIDSIENATTASTEAAEGASEDSDAESDEVASTAKLFDYYEYSAEGVEGLVNLENLKTVLIFPETGYELTSGGQVFMKTLQYLNPGLQVNAPGEAGTENLIAVLDVETPDVSEEIADDLLTGLLEEKVEMVYEECNEYKKADGDAVLTGKSLIYVADPDTDDWGDSMKYASIGEVKVAEAAKEGIKVPSSVNDYQTFVYVYPTYSRTGVYTSGTKAYSQNLHVKVFNMQDKIAYESKSVGTAAAPQSFSYFQGSVPDKHSGEVGIDKVYDYLKKLETN
jgi:hypothetical protein